MAERLQTLARADRTLPADLRLGLLLKCFRHEWAKREALLLLLPALLQLPHANEDPTGRAPTVRVERDGVRKLLFHSDKMQVRGRMEQLLARSAAAVSAGMSVAGSLASC